MSLYNILNCIILLTIIPIKCNTEIENKSLVYSFEQFRVCGAYCGPGWCNNKWLNENICDTSVEPEHHHITGISCADLCCKNHDKCCGQKKSMQHNCNNEIVNCLSKCNPLSLTCTFDDIPILASEIEFAMNIINNWCCGSKCPQ
tara:strand:- start:818 stop:1252 length:435 start_codon:yes stop_codon:yes gene_type:complete